MNRLPRFEIETLTVDEHGLRFEADQMHFDAAIRCIPPRVVGKAFQPEVAIEFAVDALQQIQIEGSGDLLPIVVGGQQSANVFREVHSDDRGPFSARLPANAPQK